MEFIQHSSLAVNHDLNYDFFWKDKIHTSNISLRQLAKKALIHTHKKLMF